VTARRDHNRASRLDMTPWRAAVRFALTRLSSFG
jgi:hypothetical protein